MSRYDDHRSSTGTLDYRDRYNRYSRGPSVAERARVVDDERFELRLREGERYGPPARAPGRRYEDEHLIHTSGALVAPDRRRRRDESAAFARPRLLRRQSSLDTFDRIPRHKMETLEIRDRERVRMPHVPAPPGRPGRVREVYEDIRIAEPDTYGDEEFREMRRSRSTVRHRHEEKPYPRKGKTRMPRHMVHLHAILDLGYPYKEEEETIVIQKALSKDQIDEVINLSREFRRPSHRETEYIEVPSPRRTTEHLVVDSYSPRTSHETMIVEPSRNRDDYRDVEYKEVVERVERPVHHHHISRPRSVSIHTHRVASPVRLVEPRGYIEERIESRPAGSMVLVRPRHSEVEVAREIRDLEDERRMLRLERHGGIEITRERDTEIIDSHGHAEEVTEVRREERREPSSRVMRAMMATLT
ncbi:hypothetical protein N7495_000351 [Penicillium taxi]|uniref:uncharacterized protein n=1 Tax=Penicillium taxi TaxID=168475 RepID=UPI0025457494|nr:uncharacterized protein N7495_000351 [Penicillium taxi]KAJ5907669.1 hypothetical protein N7495_000351 [Penicillium taxi]